MTSTNEKPIEYMSPEVIEYDFIENTLGGAGKIYESDDGYYYHS